MKNTLTNFPQATEADKGYSEMEILSSTSSSAKSSLPWAMAPMKKTTGSFWGSVVTYEESLTVEASLEKAVFAKKKKVD